MDYSSLIDYLNGQATPEEQKAVEEWLDASPENRKQLARVRRLWAASAEALAPGPPDVDAAWKRVHGRIRPPARLRWLTVMARAAVVILFILAGYWGRHIALPAPQLESRQGEALSLEPVLLPDGSKAWLQRRSVLYYPESFKGRERLVRLSGEAFFEVSHDEAHPFVIQAGAACVRVLGTSFGLMAYPDSSRALVQVASGKVAFYPEGREGDQMVLEKGEGGVLDKKSGKVQPLKRGGANRIAWRTGKLDFRNATLREMADILEHTYGVKVIFENPRLARCRFTASFDDEPLEVVLQTLNTLFHIEWRQEGPAIMLNGEGC